MGTTAKTQPVWTTERYKHQTPQVVNKTAEANCGCKILLHKSLELDGWKKQIYLYPCKQGQADFAPKPYHPSATVFPCIKMHLECSFNKRNSWKEAQRIGKEFGHFLEAHSQ